MSRMWSLDDFRYDEQVPGDEVLACDDDGHLALMPKADALRRARERGLNLVTEWPPDADGEPVVCIIVKVTLPIRWERADEPPEALDERLWFIGHCGGRDLLTGNGHTFTGRMSAYCPTKDVGYNVSLNEIVEMSDEARWYIRGFLDGAEPDPPPEGEDGLSPEDLAAWMSAVRRFRRTGSWYGRWGTCAECGCVLLPDSSEDRCAEHVVHEE